MEVRMRCKLAASLLLMLCFASQGVTQARPLRIRVSEEAMQRRLIKRVDPQWPAETVHVQGVVTLKALVDKRGSVEKLELISGHPLLVAAAVDAVKQWKYQPITMNGNAMEVETTIHVKFQVRDKDSKTTRPAQ